MRKLYEISQLLFVQFKLHVYKKYNVSNDYLKIQNEKFKQKYFYHQLASESKK